MTSGVDHVFYTGMAVANVITVFVGFAPLYYLGHYFGAPLTPLVHLHGLVFTSWIVLFLAQTVLLASRRTRLQQRLGLAGAGLAAGLVAVGLATAVASARRDATKAGAAALALLAIPLGDMLVFAILVAAGIVWRRRPETHKRLMLLATIGLLGAVISKWPIAIVRARPAGFFLVTDLFVLAAAGHDLASRRQVHPAYLWGGLVLLVSQPVRLAIAPTDAWIAIARRVVELAG